MGRGVAAQPPRSAGGAGRAGRRRRGEPGERGDTKETQEDRGAPPGTTDGISTAGASGTAEKLRKRARDKGNKNLQR